jgi:dTDP-glucose pyrophosphorylase
LANGKFTFLLFPVDRPELFDAVITDDAGRVERIQVKEQNAASNWIWGAFKLTGAQFASLHKLWIERRRNDEYLGTLVNAYIAMGGEVCGVKKGEVYVDVGTLHGYREAVRVLSDQAVSHELAS